MRTPRSVSPEQLRGRSLIEVMVAMVIGLIVLAAVLMSTSGGSGTSRQQEAIARLNENASLAANILANQIKLAGYSAPFALSLTTVLRNYVGQPLHGCDGGYVANNTLTNQTCVGAGSDGFTVFYEADTVSTQPTALGLPTDCLGTGINAVTPSAIAGRPNIAVAQNRFYINNGTLMCVGNGAMGAGGANAQPPQPLMENVEDLQLTYGVAALSNPLDPDSQPLFRPVSYLTAAQVNAMAVGGAPPDPVRNWRQVVSVRACLVLRTERNVLDDNTPPLVQCGGNGVATPVAQPADRRAYKVVNFVVSLRNRTTPCADTTVAGAAANLQTATLCPQAAIDQLP